MIRVNEALLFQDKGSWQNKMQFLKDNGKAAIILLPHLLMQLSVADFGNLLSK